LHQTAWFAFVLQANVVPNKALNNLLTIFLRFSNTAVGSAHWIWTAQKLGLQ